jgi:ribosomal protein S18 acetylase RimI-like enzyme
LKQEKKNPKLIYDSLRLRLANEEDTGEISCLYYQWLSFGSPNSRVDELRKAIRKKEIIVAVNNMPRKGRVVGFVHGSLHTYPISGGPLLCITSLYVVKRFRGLGVGSQMLRMLLRRARSEGALSAELGTSRRRAIKFYKRLGFSQFKGDMGEIHLGLDLKKYEL